MNKELLTVALAFGCIAANASTNNYDLLGRKGSKMNSPMVYRNVDYSKAKKNKQQKLGSSLENRSLAKSGLNGNYEAIGGAYDSRYNGSKFLFHKYYPSSVINQPEGCSNDYPCYNWEQYKERVNAAVSSGLFLKERRAPYPTIEGPGNYSHMNYFEEYPCSSTNSSECTFFTYSWREPTTSSVYTGWSNPGTYSIELFDHAPGNPNQPSQHESGLHYYLNFKSVKSVYSKERSIQNWYDDKSSEVGVYMSADALPVQLGDYKFVGYVKSESGPNSEVYEMVPGKEMRESITHSLITAASTHAHGNVNLSRALIYVGKGNPKTTTPTFSDLGACRYSQANCAPDIYMGVRSNDIVPASKYNNKARLLDNFIYTHRTVEFVPSGNYGQYDGSGDPKMNERAFAANAITVGAIDQTHKVANYTSTVYNQNDHYKGVQKPEVYNYSRIHVVDDKCRKYNNYDRLTYCQYYDGTEVSAAYTAGMVSNLLATNPFYRWHPEVVKALLLTSDGYSISASVPYQVTTTAPSYKYLVFDDAKASNYGQYSRYWTGDINKLKANSGDQPEIFFIVDNKNYKNRAFKAAIAWLNSGEDIAANNGKASQDFDLYIYGKNGSAPTMMNKGDRLAYSTNAYSSFEKVDVPASKSNYDWIAVRIVLYADNNSAENKNQVVLGFNLATVDPNP